jgi:hypothetical protein
MIYIYQPEHGLDKSLVGLIESIKGHGKEVEILNESIFNVLEKRPEAILYQEGDLSDKEIELAQAEDENLKLINLSELGLHESFNASIYQGGEPIENAKSDVVVIADSHMEDEWAKALCSQPICVKIYGEQPFYYPNYLGRPTMQEMKNIIASAKILVSFGDPEWFCAAISNDIPALIKKTPSDMPWEFNSFSELMEKVEECLDQTPEWMDEVKKDIAANSYENKLKEILC